ncbi:hypothetical protein [Streptomyces sp. TR06-5]|uniref:hypothetical protein n=1 Tax=unclassified Streptomyces TaxID=2593676 RepID=UPI0039A19640
MRRTGAAAAAVTVLLGLCACGGGGDGNGPSVADIRTAFDSDEPGTVTGEKTTLTGTVTQVISTSAFQLSEDDQPLLVLTKKNEQVPNEGDDVRVRGTVREFHASDAQDRLDERQADRLGGQREGDPYLRATSVEPDGGGGY